MHDADKRWLGWESEAAKAREIELTKRRVGWFHWGMLFLGIVLIVYSQSHDTVAVEVPVVDGVLLEQYKAERNQARKQRDDYKRLSVQLQAMVKASNMTVQKYEEQLKALAVSVPPQPVILQAIQREAATEKGLRQVVARSFGAEITKRIRVIE